jgi:methylenetetrahydrofolate dehydrogenase (NADP+)/methenyltetrahydrofolate cyclohydrolase
VGEATVMRGKPVAESVTERVKQRVDELLATGHQRPHLTVIQVGEDPASTVYVRNKVRTCEKLGLGSTLHNRAADTPQEEVVALIRKLNANGGVHGILVQLPLPGHMDEQAVIGEIDPLKDVDCLHPSNVGRLWLGNAFVTPCTPQGIIEILRFHGIALKGKRAAIIGRSNIVGKPLAALMLAEHATVTLCHSRTVDLPAVAREAEVLVAAVGKAEMVTGEYIREGAVVIDVGVNRTPVPGGKDKLVGDVKFDEAAAKASAITPVPGGVGPMTIAMLMSNALKCYEQQIG